MVRAWPRFALLACGLVACGGSPLTEHQRDTGAAPSGDAAIAGLAPDAGLADLPRDSLAPPSDTGAPGDGAGADVEEPGPDGDGSEPVKCLPDGTGRFVLQTSGGLDIDVALGNDFFCPGSVGPDGTGYLNWAVPVRGTDLRAAFNVTVPALMKGLTSNARPVQLVVLIAGDQGNIWNAPDLCKLDLTANGPAPGAAAKVFRMTGAIRCPPITGQRQPSAPLTIQKFEFTSAVTFE